MEPSALRRDFIEGRTNEVGEAPTEGYRLWSNFREAPTPELRAELRARAYQGLLHLTYLSLPFFALSVGMGWLTIFGSTGPKAPEESTRDSLSVLQLFLLWSLWSMVGVGGLLGWLKPGSVPVLLALTALLTYAPWIPYLGKNRPHPVRGWKDLGRGFFALLVAVTVSEWVLSLFDVTQPVSADFAYSWIQGSVGTKLSLLIFALLLAPFFEELVFRGWLLRGLEPTLGGKGAVVVSSAFFALGHGYAAAILPLFCLGLILGWLYLRNRSLWLNVALHSAWNVVSVLHLLAAIPAG